ncbi:MAG: FtsQ-type POTRA domain-containing protein, partial [Clostridia bacterium]|nr:FtsQ-type POTRA domain-containing protein [Clostridia bacterium]
AAGIGTGKNIFLENLGGAERRIEAIPRVKAAELKRVFPNRICITITEREAYAYIPAGGGYALVADDGIVLEIAGGDISAKISQVKIPVFDSGDTSTEEDKPLTDKDSKNSVGSENEDTESDAESGEEDKENSDSVAENGEGETKAAESGAADSGEQGAEIANVPATAGVELKDAAEGKKAESDNVDRLSKIYELCRGLKGADLLKRTTYINIENMEDIRLVIENRLEVLLGKADNIDYRCKFLAEVINTKISASESVILDYRGDDIYAENRDDGKDRVDKSVRKKTESKSNSDKSAGSTNAESGQDRENTGTDDDSESDTDSGTGGSTKRPNSADLSEDEEEE